jgi:isoquinoline 1-oxidoreductase alpha subunit
MAKKDFRLRINGETRDVVAEPTEPLLWVVRDRLGLKGTKFGCGAGMCGSCKVLVDGEAWPSCRLPVSAVARGQRIFTIEGLGTPERLSAVQRAFVEHGAFGCGYCTAGMIIAATALLLRKRNPSRRDIVAAMDGNLCRCAAYPDIIAAIEQVAASTEAIEPGA